MTDEFDLGVDGLVLFDADGNQLWPAGPVSPPVVDPGDPVDPPVDPGDPPGPVTPPAPSVPAGPLPPRRTVRILFRFDWTDGQITRLWLGGGPYVDANLDLWRGSALVDDSQLDDIEQAVNGNASTLNVALSGVSSETAGAVWIYYQGGNLIGSTMQIMIQPCDARHRPVGSPRVVFGGNLDNVVFDDAASEEGVLSTVTAQVTNKFQVRNLTNGAVLSDADQRARAKILNPSAPPDRFAERVVLMQTKSLVWPRFSG